MLKKLISELIDPILADLTPNWIDRYGGLVETLEVKKVIDPNDIKKVQVQKYPISCSVNQQECDDPNSIYSDLVPDESKASIVYWEELVPMQFSGNLERGSQVFKNYQKWNGKARLVVWLNAAKLGVGTQNGNYSCDWYFPYLDQLTSLLSVGGNMSTGDFAGGIYKVQAMKIPPKDLSIFSKYTYDKYINYHRYPYDYFAIDFDFSITYCVGSNSIIPSGSVIACPFSQSQALVNSYSMMFEKLNKGYMAAVAHPSISFPEETTSGITFSVWCMTGGNANTRILSKKSSSVLADSAEYELTLDTSNRVALLLFDKDTIGGNNFLFVKTDVSIPVGGPWAHICVTYDCSKTAAGINFYIDGVLQSTMDLSVGTYGGMEETLVPLTIGRAGFVDDFYYGGNQEELSIWGAAFDQVEVDAIYNNGLPTNLLIHSQAANLRLWSRMGDGDFWNGLNWELYDNSINNNTLTSVNMQEADRETDVPT